MEREKSPGGQNPDISSSATTTAAAAMSDDVFTKYKSDVLRFFNRVGMSTHVPQRFDTKHFYSDLIGGLLKVQYLERGRISCLLAVKPPVTPISAILPHIEDATIDLLRTCCQGAVDLGVLNILS